MECFSKLTFGRYFIAGDCIRKDNGSGDQYYYVYDALGDVKEIRNVVGVLVVDYDYDIYGEEKSTGTTSPKNFYNPIRYSGQYFDEESGLYYLRARYYLPEIMRFISEDTYKGSLDNPLTLNYYTYCVGNPVMLFDPSGNFAISAFVTSLITKAVIGAATGFVVSVGTQVYRNWRSGEKLSKIDWWAVGGATAGGAIASLGGRWTSKMLLSAGGNMVNGLISRDVKIMGLLKGDMNEFKKLGGKALVGLVTGAIGKSGETIFENTIIDKFFSKTRGGQKRFLLDVFKIKGRDVNKYLRAIKADHSLLIKGFKGFYAGLAASTSADITLNGFIEGYEKYMMDIKGIMEGSEEVDKSESTTSGAISY